MTQPICPNCHRNLPTEVPKKPYVDEEADVCTCSTCKPTPPPTGDK